MSENTILCPSCGKEVVMNGAAFCPFCGASLTIKPIQAEEPEEVHAALAKLADLPTPEKKHKLMDELLQKYPDSLAVNEEKLFLVRIPDKKRRKADFSVIKCHLLHFYLTPEDFSLEEMATMRQEIFFHPQLQRCIELSGDEKSYMYHYLERLCSEFVELFLHGSTLYSRSLFGFRLENRMDKILATPACKMMKQIHEDEFLTADQRSMLYSAMFRGFEKDVGNGARLRELLAQYELPQAER